MKKKLFLAFALLALTVQAFSQAAGNYYYNQKQASQTFTNSNSNADEFDNGYGGYNNPVYQQASTYYPVYSSNDTSFIIEAKVMMNVKADEYVIILGTSQVGETVESCHELINKRIETFLTAVAPLGIKKEDVYIDFIAQFPIFEIEVEKKLFSKSYNEIPKGFEVRKNIHIHYKDQKIVEQLLVQAAKNEVYDIVKVDYIVNDMAAVYDSLRTTCVNLINKKAKDFKKNGIKIDMNIYQTVSEKIYSAYPIENYSTFVQFERDMGGEINKLGSKMPFRSDVPALYYNKDAYNSYDLVLNPVVVEPVVQFVCTVTVKYVLKKQ